MYEFNFQIPSYYILLVRSLTVLEVRSALSTPSTGTLDCLSYPQQSHARISRRRSKGMALGIGTTPPHPAAGTPSSLSLGPLPDPAPPHPTPNTTAPTLPLPPHAGYCPGQ